MSRFRISSHGRLQDWIAVEHGYFEEEGLDYEFDVRALENAAQDVAGDGQHDIRVGAYELYLSGGGGKKNMSCACHWAVNQAAADSAGSMWGHAYSVLPSGIYIPADSEIRGWLSLWQSLLDHPGARAVPANRADKAPIRRLSVRPR
jgi:NitT/TauT family transport system substrate-binding protein